jgi:hypothetical protein
MPEAGVDVAGVDVAGADAVGSGFGSVCRQATVLRIEPSQSEH